MGVVRSVRGIGERMLQVGDTIKCHDKEEMAQLMTELEKEDIPTDFLYEKKGVKGLWLVVVGHY